mgnify:FL=1
MTIGRYYMLDPHDLEARFSAEEGMAYMASIFTEPSEEAMAKMPEVREVIEVIPPMEADFVEMFYFLGCKQTDIAEIFQVSQPTVCYRLQRAAARIKYLLEIPKITKEQIKGDLAGLLKAEEDGEILWLMYTTTCQSAVAKHMGVSQGLVRHRFLRSLAILQQYPHLALYSEIFTTVLNNPNILRDMTSPSTEETVQQLVVH